jgi:hypothetical protein
MKHSLLLLALCAAAFGQSALTALPAGAPNKPVNLVPADYDGPIANLSYFKTKPGKLDEYSKWLADVAKPVDDWAQEHGAFESCITYVNRDPNAPWTHLRIFMFKNRAQMQGMAAVMDAAHKALYPDEAKREAALGNKGEMRDQVGMMTVSVIR